MADDDAIWRELRRLDERATAQERALDRHLGECSVRHQEVIRRQEESRLDRAQLRVDLAHSTEQMRASVDRLRGWITGLVLTVAGALIAGGGTMVLKLAKVIP